MTSSDTTEAARSWHFLMHPQTPLTPEQSDISDGLDCFGDGFVSVHQGHGYTKFECYFQADTLMDAMEGALACIEDIPGVRIRSIELNPRSFEHNGMATAAVVPWPPEGPDA